VLGCLLDCSHSYQIAPILRFQTDFRYFSVVFGVAEREVKGPDPQIHPNLLDCGDRPFKKSILKFGTI